jgi:hypothetical protein
MHALPSHEIPAPSSMHPSPAADNRSLPRHVVRLAGEIDGFELEDKLGMAGLCWLCVVCETGLAVHPSPPSPPPPASACVAALKTQAVANEGSVTRHVLCLAGQVFEDVLVDKLGLTGLNWLRAKGLLTYPSPVIGRLFDQLPYVFAAEVLPHLDPADRAAVAQVGPLWLAAVVASGLPRAGKSAGLPLKLNEFVGSVHRLAWAKEIGCPWNTRTCALAAAGGHLAVLKWLREHRCPWDSSTCAAAAEGGYLEVLQWLWEHHCPWSPETCNQAAGGGHLEVLHWARAHGCPWDEDLEGHDLEGGCGLLRTRRGGRAPGSAAVGAGESLPVARLDVYACRSGRAPRGVEVGAPARLPVER